MRKKAGRLGLGALIIVILLTVGWGVFYNMEVGMVKAIGSDEVYSPGGAFPDIPPSVVEDATRLGRELVKNSHDKLQDTIDQLLGTYVKARESDVVVFFNPGGWGWNKMDKAVGWSSILGGIQSELEGLGSRALVLNYQRTSKGLYGCIREFTAVVTRYPAKASELAKRVTFLTDHITGLKVIIAGESTGTVISDKTMGMLRNDGQVYSIQTGTPFWYQPSSPGRTLLMNSNGKTVDTFSYGNIPAMVWATVKGWLGFSSPEDNAGRILNWLRAPGHDYSWEYPGVSSEVIKFLKANFAAKK